MGAVYISINLRGKDIGSLMFVLPKDSVMELLRKIKKRNVRRLGKTNEQLFSKIATRIMEEYVKVINSFLHLELTTSEPKVIFTFSQYLCDFISFTFSHQGKNMFVKADFEANQKINGSLMFFIGADGLNKILEKVKEVLEK